MRFISRLFARPAPALSEARPADAAAIAFLHKASFQHGWGEDEVHRLLIESNVVAVRKLMKRAAPDKRVETDPLEQQQQASKCYR